MATKFKFGITTKKYKFPIIESSENKITTLQIYIKDQYATFEDVEKVVKRSIECLFTKGIFEDNKVKVIMENYYPYLKQ